MNIYWRSPPGGSALVPFWLMRFRVNAGVPSAVRETLNCGGCGGLAPDGYCFIYCLEGGVLRLREPKQERGSFEF